MWHMRARQASPASPAHHAPPPPRTLFFHQLDRSLAAVVPSSGTPWRIDRSRPLGRIESIRSCRSWSFRTRMKATRRFSTSCSDCGSFVVLAVLVLCFFGGVVSGVKETPCTSAYNYFAGCLTFVSGPDAQPNPICCGGVGHLNDIDPYCLCTIINELGDNPNVNFTKACVLPLQCNIPVDVVQCPTLMAPPGYPLPPSLPPAPHHTGVESAAAPRPSHFRSLLLFSLFVAARVVL